MGIASGTDCERDFGSLCGTEPFSIMDDIWILFSTGSGGRGLKRFGTDTIFLLILGLILGLALGLAPCDWNTMTQITCVRV